MTTASKVLMVGLDAADGELVLGWIRDGELPTLAALAERGVAVPMNSAGEDMPESSWASLISGTPAGDHGIYSWRIVQPGSYERARMAHGGWRRPFWWVLRNHAPDPKPRIVVFDVPYAAGLRDDGVTEFGGWGLRVTREIRSSPPELADEIVGRHPPHPPWINRDYDRNPFSERRYLRKLKSLSARRTEVALELLGRDEWECAIVNFTEPHFAGHAYYHHLQSAEPARRRSRYAAPGGLLESYREADRQLARLIDAAGPDADVLVFSTIGLRPNETSRDLLGEILIALGYEFRAPPTPASRGRRAAMRAVGLVPRFLRHRLRKLIPVGTAEAAADRAWGEAIDWSRSRAVSEAEPGSAWLRINLAGRMPHGIVDPADREALIAEIRADLGALIDPATGRPAVAEVVSVDAVAPGDLVGQMPDMLVRWTPGSRIRSVRHPRVGLIDDGGGPYARTEHTGGGFLVAAGPSISSDGLPGGASPPREFDLAPTVLHAFDCPVPEGMGGEVLEWLLEERPTPVRAAIDTATEPSL